MLRLSPYVLPQPRLGIHPLRPQNLSDGADRVRYAKHVIDIARALANRGAVEEARRWRNEVPFGQNLIMWREHGSHVHLDPLPELANALTFSVDELGILFRDGRQRDDGKMVYLPTADATSDVLALIRLLHRGIGESQLLEDPRAEQAGLDADLVASLVTSGVIEHGSVTLPARAAAFAMEWMGHAWVRALSPHGSVWFDPFAPPRIAWTPDEQTSLFEAAVPDRLLLRDYGPSAHQVTLDELAIPEAIFITHQDSDHMDLGMLAMVPPEVPIYVPVHDADKPWQLDLVAVLRAVLGAERNVIELPHDRTVTVAGIEVTAFPFVGEFPAALPHRWNGYFVKLPEQQWALCADSAVTQLHVDWLRDRRRNEAPLGIMVNGLAERPIVDGYRDVFDEVTSFNRLYSWYLPPHRLFDPVPACGLPLEVLQRLVREVGLTNVFFYAHGNLPWYRMQDTLLHRSHVGSHSLGLWLGMTKVVEDNGARVVGLQHGIPYM